MNEELEKQLAKAIEQGLNLAEKTGEFVIDQAPDLMQQFLAWHMYSSLFFVALGLILITTCYVLIKKGIKIIEGDSGFEDAVVACFFVGGISGIAGLFMAFINTYDLIKVVVAPKIYIIDYFLK